MGSGGGAALRDLKKSTRGRLEREDRLGAPFHVARGADVFVSTWNLHRSEDLWEEPLRFNPDRWRSEFKNPRIEGWKGFRPERVTGLYPDEQATDFAFLPFGGGARKCVGERVSRM